MYASEIVAEIGEPKNCALFSNPYDLKQKVIYILPECAVNATKRVSGEQRLFPL